eukprot:13483531-Heterocapsa_arctica.AAC.1
MDEALERKGTGPVSKRPNKKGLTDDMEKDDDNDSEDNDHDSEMKGSCDEQCGTPCFVANTDFHQKSNADWSAAKEQEPQKCQTSEDVGRAGS